ncbi:MAG: tRNA (guanine(46)-N(7))-methyltransferase TrmB [Myxococcota bacterium]
MTPFRDKLPAEFLRPEVNPYVASHRAFGPEILPASEAQAWRGRWGELFGRAAPLHVEIGSGNGFYLSGMAALHPEADWIGVELRYKRVELAARKLRAAGIAHARVVRYDATRLDELFEPGSLAGLHVNHPDPWARRSQAKHRMIGRGFAELAARLLAPGAELRLKTDFRPHVDALLAVLGGLPFRVEGDLVDAVPWPDDVVTNYQRKAIARGAPVWALLLRRA